MDTFKRAADRVKSEVVELRTTVKAKLDSDDITAGVISQGSSATGLPLHTGMSAATMSLIDACLEAEGLDAATTRQVGEAALSSSREQDVLTGKIAANVRREHAIAKNIDDVLDKTLEASGEVGIVAAQLKESRRFLSMNCRVEFVVTAKGATPHGAASTTTGARVDAAAGSDVAAGGSDVLPHSEVSPTKRMRRLSAVESVEARFEKNWGTEPEDRRRVEAGRLAVEQERLQWMARVDSLLPLE